MGSEDSDDDTPRLSAHTLAALQDFLSARDPAAHLDDGDEEINPAATEGLARGGETKGNEMTLDIVSEDWRLSQFWYDQPTARAVAQELFFLSKQFHSPIACISCPSLYVELKKNYAAEVFLFEYDPRFQRYGNDYTFYDYNFPEELPERHHHAFHVVVADPPYLSRECIEKTVQTMKLIAKDDDTCFLLLTGAVQQDYAKDLLGACPCVFKPTHQNKLGNEFLLYTSYDPLDRLGGWMK
ncbi:hypothetical protein KP509_01G032900 [Ceratopteris richardii]|uniref:Protein-lysine N-methyltransferase KP509_01G032900 n=1 Tax=Ceratopteris richardii TaxID=49495 RepID=A0A8T2VKC2_CERRI|nr:hypothetical protein KP509_01G032900 [Ceratopteris richardii]